MEWENYRVLFVVGLEALDMLKIRYLKWNISELENFIELWSIITACLSDKPNE